MPKMFVLINIDLKTNIQRIIPGTSTWWNICWFQNWYIYCKQILFNFLCWWYILWGYSLCWYLADGDGACMYQGFWQLYRWGLKLLAGLTKPGRCRRRDRTKPSTWSSRLGVGLGANNNYIVVVVLCPTRDGEDNRKTGGIFQLHFPILYNWWYIDI